MSKTAPKKTTTRKKRVPKKDSLAAQGLDKVHIDEAGQPALTEIQLLIFNASMAQADAAQAEWKLAEKEVLFLLQGLPEYTKLRAAADAKKHEFQKKSQAYMLKLENLSRELGLDMKQCIINDSSGKLTFLDADGKISPDAPPYDPHKK